MDGGKRSFTKIIEYKKGSLYGDKKGPITTPGTHPVIRLALRRNDDVTNFMSFIHTGKIRISRYSGKDEKTGQIKVTYSCSFEATKEEKEVLDFMYDDIIDVLNEDGNFMKFIDQGTLSRVKPENLQSFRQTAFATVKPIYKVYVKKGEDPKKIENQRFFVSMELKSFSRVTKLDGKSIIPFDYKAVLDEKAESGGVNSVNTGITVEGMLNFNLNISKLETGAVTFITKIPNQLTIIKESSGIDLFKEMLNDGSVVDYLTSVGIDDVSVLDYQLTAINNSTNSDKSQFPTKPPTFSFNRKQQSKEEEEEEEDVTKAVITMPKVTTKKQQQQQHFTNEEEEEEEQQVPKVTKKQQYFTNEEEEEEEVVAKPIRKPQHSKKPLEQDRRVMRKFSQTSISNANDYGEDDDDSITEVPQPSVKDFIGRGGKNLVNTNWSKSPAASKGMRNYSDN